MLRAVHIYNAPQTEKSETAVRTTSGVYIDLLRPTPDAIRLSDIIRGTIRIPRWAGHTLTTAPWTVADHLVSCVVLARYIFPSMPPAFYAAVYLHDAPETYTNDLPSPFKAALRALGAGEALKTIEFGLERAIHIRFSIPDQLPSGWREKIKEIDLLARRIEEAVYRPTPHEPGYLPAGLSSSALPLPTASEGERIIRTMNCWHQIVAERILAENGNVRHNRRLSA